MAGTKLHVPCSSRLMPKWEFLEARYEMFREGEVVAMNARRKAHRMLTS